MVECNRALLNMETTERAKEILKIKIGFIKYGVKDAYKKTVILSRGLRELELNIIKNIIKYAGFCDSDIRLEHIVQFNNHLSSRAIVSNETGRNISNTDSNLGQNIVRYTDCTNVGCNIS